ncbi:MAG: redoxin domain-containing protein [Anaerolineae bacterium]|nr:MAG: redoxin domain-containing protein [Anaerolineae bacterium]
MVGSVGHTVRGSVLEVHETAPDFELTANNFSVRTLKDYEGKIKILSVVPSLDTPVCSAQTRRFSQEAANPGEDVMVLTISADLPFAQNAGVGQKVLTGWKYFLPTRT